MVKVYYFRSIELIHSSNEPGITVIIIFGDNKITFGKDVILLKKK